MTDDGDQFKPKGLWYRLVPELRHFSTRGESEAVGRAFRVEMLGGVLIWCAVVGMVVFVGGLGTVLALVENGVSPWPAVLLSGGFWFLVMVAGLFRFWHRPYVQFVRRYLHGRGVPICVGCGYDLRGQREPRCPECGRGFDGAILDSW